MAHSNLTVEQTYLDIGIHNGAPNNYPSADGVASANTAWLSGYADHSDADAKYPGHLDGFRAANSSSNKVAGQLRMISLAVKCTDENATTTFDVNAYDSDLNYVMCVLSAWNDTDTDEDIIGQAYDGAFKAFTIAHEDGKITMDIGTDNDIVLLTFLAA
jgi:hypothetical protein